MRHGRQPGAQVGLGGRGGRDRRGRPAPALALRVQQAAQPVGPPERRRLRGRGRRGGLRFHRRARRRGDGNATNPPSENALPLLLPSDRTVRFDERIRTFERPHSEGPHPGRPTPNTAHHPFCSGAGIQPCPGLADAQARLHHGLALQQLVGGGLGGRGRAGALCVRRGKRHAVAHQADPGTGPRYGRRQNLWPPMHAVLQAHCMVPAPAYLHSRLGNVRSGIQHALYRGLGCLREARLAVVAGSALAAACMRAARSGIDRACMSEPRNPVQARPGCRSHPLQDPPHLGGAASAGLNGLRPDDSSNISDPGQRNSHTARRPGHRRWETPCLLGVRLPRGPRLVSEGQSDSYPLPVLGGRQGPASKPLPRVPNRPLGSQQERECAAPAPTQPPKHIPRPLAKAPHALLNTWLFSRLCRYLSSAVLRSSTKSASRECTNIRLGGSFSLRAMGVQAVGARR